MKVNLHTHTTYCDGKNSVEEMIQDAIVAGFDVLGFSGHSYTSFDESYCMSREQTVQYVAEVRRLAEKYKENIKVFCGIEQDLFADDSVEGFDYAIGSVHAIFKECDAATLAALKEAGALPPPEGIVPVHEVDQAEPEKSPARTGFYIYVDWDAAAMAWAIRWLYSCDSLGLAEDYFAHVAQVADMPGVQIVGHFDLLTKFNEQRLMAGRPPLFDTEDPRYQKAAFAAIQRITASGRTHTPVGTGTLKDTGTLKGTSTLSGTGTHPGISTLKCTGTHPGTGKIFEINTGAMSKGYRTTPYPSLPLLKEIRQAGGRIMINSDCHAAGKLDWGYNLAAELAREAGFIHLTVPEIVPAAAPTAEPAYATVPTAEPAAESAAGQTGGQTGGAYRLKWTEVKL